MRTSIATGLKADGTHVCLYVGADAAAAIKCALQPDPRLGCVATAVFVRPIPTKARKFDQAAVDLSDKAKIQKPKTQKAKTT